MSSARRHPTRRRSLRARFGTPEATPHLRVIAATVGPGKARLLELIEETGSISAAARHMGMSYLRAWQLAEALNQAFREPLIASDPGGARGGGSALTATGLKVLKHYRSLGARCRRAAAGDLRALHRLLRV
jgi:molybdate transport system regulatory protein